eukprot:m.193447 g.193447  ORF g.193447 m.193447 type:complete len:222 (-) comp14880_c0_seq1:257-922(-)
MATGLEVAQALRWILVANQATFTDERVVAQVKQKVTEMVENGVTGLLTLIMQKQGSPQIVFDGALGLDVLPHLQKQPEAAVHQDTIPIDLGALLLCAIEHVKASAVQTHQDQAVTARLRQPSVQCVVTVVTNAPAQGVAYHRSTLLDTTQFPDSAQPCLEDIVSSLLTMGCTLQFTRLCHPQTNIVETDKMMEVLRKKVQQQTGFDHSLLQHIEIGKIGLF